MAKFDVAVIGAGAAGMMCAAVAAQRGKRVVLIDHAAKLAEKIRISGGGRCNFTNINAGIMQVAVRAYSASVAARDFRHARSGRFSYFMLCGGAAFVLGHFLLSWGTNLAIFPIMGQPMSFLSAGGSHLLFFLCPLLAF